MAYLTSLGNGEDAPERTDEELWQAHCDAAHVSCNQCGKEIDDCHAPCCAVGPRDVRITIDRTPFCLDCGESVLDEMLRDARRAR